MFSRLEEVEKKYRDLEAKMGHSEFAAQAGEFQKAATEVAALKPIIDNYLRYKKLTQDIQDNKHILETENDEGLRQMAKDEIPALEEEKARLEKALQVQLLPKDPNDDKNIFLEIRAGTGGDEAALFAAELFRMYSRYAEVQRWQVEIVSASETDKGGFKEIIASISGASVYSRLKYESGTHRVQRVPETEANGRVHTSAVTVAILPEAEDIEINIPETDIKMDVMRAGGAGGQHVNKTESAVRLTHLPSGLVVICRDGRSQHKNRAQAMKVLKTRLLDLQTQKQSDSEAAKRKEMVGSGDRSEKIRTYNFPQGRVTDHRINETVYQLDAFMGGKLDLLVEPLVAYYQAEALKKEVG